MSTPNPLPSIASWIDPTTNTDGSPIADGEITGYEIGARDTTAAGSVAGTYPYSFKAPPDVLAEPLSMLTPVLPKGVKLAAAMRTNTAGPNSDWTAEVTFTLPVPLPVPNPPSGFSVA
jgi:hypothetical protein